MKTLRRLIPLLAALLVAALSASALAAEACRTIHIVDHGYHTGLIVRAPAFDAVASLGTEGFSGASWLEFGWGDAAYYQAKDPPLSMAISALLNSGGSALHIVGHRGDPTAIYAGKTILTLQVSASGHDRLVQRLRATVVRDDRGEAVPLSRFNPDGSRFYRATGDYSLAYTCNHWMADLLVEAGVPIDPSGAALSSDLMDKLVKIDSIRCK